MRVCHRCGTENPTEANFCMRCGAALTSRVGGEERKVITVLFCDLVEFTARAERMDPEDVKETLRAYHTSIKDLIERHGGTVEKFLGDGVIGVFGMPVAHEDDPERAVRAALRTLGEIGELNVARELDLHIRIGVNTGEALVSTVPGEQIGGSIAGDVVNTCARLQAAAPVDGVLVGEATYRATASAFIYEEREPVLAKGKSTPLMVWRPLRARSRVERSSIDEDPPFVGRDPELAVLRDAFRLAQEASGEGNADPTPPVMVLITGEAGVGKTRLIREFAGYLDALPTLVRWRRGRSLPYGDGVRFWALGEIVKSEAGILDTDDPSETGRKLDAAVVDLGFEPSQQAWMRAMLEPLVGLPGPAGSPSRDELFAAWRRFLGAMADGPAVIVFEDLQWADPAMLEFLTTLDQLSGVQLLVVCVARTELEDRFPGWAGEVRRAIELPLEPLAAVDGRRLLRSLLGDRRLPEATEDALLAKAGGNPLFAEEFVRMLRDDREETDGAPVIPIPNSLQSLVVARLDALAADLKEIVHDASVVGKIFWPGAVAAVGTTSADEVMVRLPFLVRRGLIMRRDTSIVEGESEFAFRHDVTLEVAYQQIPKAGRAEKHRNAAAWVRMVSGDRVADFAQEIAFHLLRALELTPGPDPDLRQATAHAQLLAAERLGTLDAPASVRAYRRALALLARDDEVRPDVFARAGAAANAIGRFDLAEPWLRQSIAAFRAAGEQLRAGEVMGMLGRSLMIQGRLAEADSVLDAAVHELEMLPPGPELATVCARIAGRAFTAGDYDRALLWAERTLAIASDGEPKEAAALALQYRGSVRAERGEREGLEDLREAIRIAREADLAEVLGATLGNLAYLTWFREGPAAALVIAREIQSFAGARGLSFDEMWGKVSELESRFDLGDWDRVLGLAGEMLAWDAEHGPSQIGMWSRFTTSWVHIRRGDVELAAEALDEVSQIPQLLEYPEFHATVTAIGAVIAQARGDRATALAKVEEFDKVVADVPEVRVHFLPIVVRVAVWGNDLATAESLVPADPGPPIERRRLSYETAVAVLDEARGDLTLAEERFGAAAAGWEAFGFPLETGQCLLGRARCLWGLGRTDEAGSDLTRAREQLAPLGARPLLEELDALRGRLEG